MKSETPLRLIGTPYEQGVQQGNCCSVAIEQNWIQIRDLIARLVGDRGEWYRSLIQRSLEFVRSLDPDTVAELEGIAAGSGMSFDDVSAMNVPLYMLLRRAHVVEECSVFAVGASATGDGCTYLVKTRDQPLDQFQFEHVVVERTYASGHWLVEVNAAGIITNPGSGVNDAGLALGTAGSWSRKRMTVELNALRSAFAMPDMHYLLRNAGTVAEAHKLLEETPRLAGMNIVLADRSGDVATVEVTGKEAMITFPDDGIASLTNHYVHADLAWANDAREENPESHARRATILSYLRERRGRLTFRDLLKLSMLHASDPTGSVCRHPNDGGGSVTRYVSLVSVEELECWAFCDNPCRMALVTSGGGAEEVRS